MEMKRRATKIFRSALDDVRAVESSPPTRQTLSAAYRLAYADGDFILREDLRPVRLQLELLKPELILNEHRIDGTIVIFGSARIPHPDRALERLRQAEGRAAEDPSDETLRRKVEIARRIVGTSRYYEEARKLASLISRHGATSDRNDFVVITGGGPGIMEAANRGAHDVGAENIGLNIALPFEEKPNEYTTPELCFQFHYFAIRKMHFLIRARALVVFPGGFGTLDELFETLTLIQTKKISPIPVLIFGREYWQRVINFDTLVDEGTISPGDIELFQYVESAEEAWEVILKKYQER